MAEVVLETLGRKGECQLMSVDGKFAKDTRLWCLLKVSGGVGETRGEVVMEGV